MTAVTELIPPDFNYAGFWVRVAAAIIDTIVLFLITTPLLVAIYGAGYIDSGGSFYGVFDFLLSFVFPIAFVILFWIYKSATPGKMLFKIKIVDATTGGSLTKQQCVIRYLGYILSTIPLLLGFIWVAFDRKKQGWHDKMAGTLVVYKHD